MLLALMILIWKLRVVKERNQRIDYRWTVWHWVIYDCDNFKFRLFLFFWHGQRTSAQWDMPMYSYEDRTAIWSLPTLWYKCTAQGPKLRKLQGNHLRFVSDIYSRLRLSKEKPQLPHFIYRCVLDHGQMLLHRLWYSSCDTWYRCLVLIGALLSQSISYRLNNLLARSFNFRKVSGSSSRRLLRI